MTNHPTEPPPPASALRTEQTLRDMWQASAQRRAEATQHHAEANKTLDAADAHDHAAAKARTTAEAETQAAQSARNGARALFNVAEARAAEAADLADIVNEKRVAAGLAPLTVGEPYPELSPGEPFAAAQPENAIDRLPEQNGARS